MYLLSGLAYLTSTRILADATSSPDCKCRPSQSCWPDSHAWSRLNITTNGALIKTIPPGIVCYPGPAYDKDACEKISELSIHHGWISDNPFNVMQPGWNGNPCPPTNNTETNTTCNGLLGDPVYVINATDASQVEAGVKFAKKYDIRLIIKNTGHEFLGRSSGAHSLRIWTHNMRKVEFTESFKPKNCAKVATHSAVTVGAGMQWRDLVIQAAPHKKLLVTGGNPTVGCIGGFLQGGGHSPVSSKYGMAVDQVLEFNLVTPSGKYITANECENADYFWALRGGGGGTFGVVTSATLKTYPTQPINLMIQTFNMTSNDTDIFWEFMGYVNSQIPRISRAGLMGYTFMYGDGTGKFGYAAALHMVNGSIEAGTEALQPIYDIALTDKYKDHIVGQQRNVTFPDFATYFLFFFQEENVGSTAVLPSRLLDERALTEDPVFFATTLKKMFNGYVGAYLSHIVAGPGVAQYKNASMALNPAWRRTYSHLIAASGWDTPEQREPVVSYAKNVLEYNLRKLAPDSGQYLNEALYGSEGWQAANWGENYPRLFEFKNKIDPDGVLYCFNCVGSEKWVEGKDGYAYLLFCILAFYTANTGAILGRDTALWWFVPKSKYLKDSAKLAVIHAKLVTVATEHGDSADSIYPAKSELGTLFFTLELPIGISPDSAWQSLKTFLISWGEVPYEIIDIPIQEHVKPKPGLRRPKKPKGGNLNKTRNSIHPRAPPSGADLRKIDVFREPFYEMQKLSQPPGLKMSDLNGFYFRRSNALGEGVTVYMPDTGAYIDDEEGTQHKEFQDINLVDYLWAGPGAGDVKRDFQHHGYHGTAVLSKIAGKRVGTAPNADIVVAQCVNGKGELSTAHYFDCLLKIYDHIVENKPRAAIINMSWSYDTIDHSIPDLAPIKEPSMEEEPDRVPTNQMIERYSFLLISEFEKLGVKLVTSSGNFAPFLGSRLRFDHWLQLTERVAKETPLLLPARHISEFKNSLIVVGSSGWKDENKCQFVKEMRCWAPGTNVQVAGYDETGSDILTPADGTSVSSPTVAGMLASFISAGLTPDNAVQQLYKLCHKRVPNGVPIVFNGIQYTEWPHVYGQQEQSEEYILP
ncbi:hypothetical protein H072_7337 [Dactylellina haptotyla CBS 200.50]|uniref:FAD-binding PCMH-type domain-containing protein n=1 Tax=Dactylellina haptotyla (strain CBS 200.50) TaxID=1284197 RepID=S8BI09_DACHA|nr:hypothetical protein H072_7337 [Dactylellina haptotyla CBS 200.50]